MTMDQPVGYMGQDYDAIVGELEGSGEKFVDEHEKEDLCQTFCDKDIEWIRASKLPCCTDDNGDVAFLRKDLTDEEGNWANNNMEREYDQVDAPNTMMDAVLGTMFWQLEGKPMDIFGKQYKETHYNDKGKRQIVNYNFNLFIGNKIPGNQFKAFKILIEVFWRTYYLKRTF